MTADDAWPGGEGSPFPLPTTYTGITTVRDLLDAQRQHDLRLTVRAIEKATRRALTPAMSVEYWITGSTAHVQVRDGQGRPVGAGTVELRR